MKYLIRKLNIKKIMNKKKGGEEIINIYSMDEKKDALSLIK